MNDLKVVGLINHAFPTFFETLVLPVLKILCAPLLFNAIAYGIGDSPGELTILKFT